MLDLLVIHLQIDAQIGNLIFASFVTDLTYPTASITSDMPNRKNFPMKLSFARVGYKVVSALAMTVLVCLLKEVQDRTKL